VCSTTNESKRAIAGPSSWHEQQADFLAVWWVVLKLPILPPIRVILNQHGHE
jgi:hypothetical protein